MKKYLLLHLQRTAAAAQGTRTRLFGRSEVRSTLIAAALSVIAPVASATSTDLSSLGPATEIVCLISNYISGPWLFCIGIIVGILGCVAIANSESTIGKVVSVVFVGIGLAACVTSIVKNHLKVSYVCT
jgi:hypothetical protein